MIITMTKYDRQTVLSRLVKYLSNKTHFLAKIELADSESVIKANRTKSDAVNLIGKF
jgi:hypothetical protein